jgi:hypothetical protein
LLPVLSAGVMTALSAVELVASVRKVRPPTVAAAGLAPAVAVAADGGPVLDQPGTGPDADLGTGSSQALTERRAVASDGLALDLDLARLEVGQADEKAREMTVAQHQVPQGSGMQFLKAAGWLVGAAVLVYLVGFTIGLPVFLFAYLVVARMGVLRAVISAVAVGLVVYFVFVHELAVTLPLSLFYTPFP